jgi:hypothetical protein
MLKEINWCTRSPRNDATNLWIGIACGLVTAHSGRSVRRASECLRQDVANRDMRCSRSTSTDRLRCSAASTRRALRAISVSVLMSQLDRRVSGQLSHTSGRSTLTAVWERRRREASPYPDFSQSLSTQMRQLKRLAHNSNQRNGLCARR